MTNIQYASIPLGDLEIISSQNGEKKDFLKSGKLKLSIYSPYKKSKVDSVIVKIKLDKNPYIEELITKKRIGLNRKDGYKIYLKGDTVYNLCTKWQAYLKITQQLNYLDVINNLFD